jgi:SAM-dependent methyltransferase
MQVFTALGYETHYARCHQFSDDYYEIMRADYQRWLLRFLPKDRNSRILDVGCGAGFAVSALQKAGYANAYGIDATPGLVEIAKSRGLPVKLIPEDETESYLASCASSLDSVLLFEVLEHLEYGRQTEFLRSIRQALLPNGIFLCNVPNALCISATYLRYNDWTHRCLFTTGSLTFALESAGLPVESLVGFPGRPSPARKGPLRVFMPAARTMLQSVVNAVWRVPVVAFLGPELGMSHPVTPNLLAVARRPV